MSPILVRPVREQLEHDRLIRLLQTKFKRKFEAGINPGAEQAVPVYTGPTPLFPDLVLQSLDRGRKVQGLIEVETGESVNHLEALAEWAHFSRVRASFHLYVPGGMVDVARRLCDDNQIYVAEIWSYHMVGDQVRFTLVFRNKETPPKQLPVRAAPPRPAAAPVAPSVPAPRAATPPRVATPPVRPAAAPKKSPKPVKKAAAKAKAKPVKKSKRK